MENSIIDTLITQDQQLLMYLNNLGNEQWDKFWLLVTNKYTFVPLYATLIFAFYRKRNLKQTLLLVLVGVLLVTASDQLANLFKYGFKRLRPCYEQEVFRFVRLVKSSCGGKYSYFSAHASTGMALAVFFGFIFKSIYKKLLYSLLIVALFVGYSRIYVGVHYPLDVATGFVFGGILGYLFYIFFRKILVSKHTFFHSA